MGMHALTYSLYHAECNDKMGINISLDKVSRSLTT